MWKSSKSIFPNTSAREQCIYERKKTMAQRSMQAGVSLVESSTWPLNSHDCSENYTKTKTNKSWYEKKDVRLPTYNSIGPPVPCSRYSPKQWMNYLTNLFYTYNSSTAPWGGGPLRKLGFYRLAKKKRVPLRMATRSVKLAHLAADSRKLAHLAPLKETCTPCNIF